MKLKDVWVNVKPKIDVTKATEAAKTFGEAIQGGLGGIKATVAKVGKGYQKANDKVNKGIAILQQITAVIDKMYDKVVDLTGTAGDIADLSYALGTTETRLLAVQRAFGQAGMGDVEGLNSMLVKYQEAVASGKIELTAGQDTITGFLDMLVHLQGMGHEERAEVLQEIGFGKQTREMHKLLGTDFVKLKKILESEAFREENRETSEVIGSYSDLGDRMQYMDREQQLALMRELGPEATADAIAALQKMHDLELERAQQYQAGDLLEGTKMKELVETVQTTIPQLLKGIMTALVGDVEERSVHLGGEIFGKSVGFDVGLGPLLSRLIQLFENIFSTLKSTGDQVTLIFDKGETSSNN